MPDYKNGKIYKLCSPQGEEIYIGSTTLPLYKRLYFHKKQQKCSSKYLFENYDNVKIELLENFPCNKKKELTKKEGCYVRENKCLKENKCLNKNVPGRTAKEWYQDSNYYEKNKEKLNKKFKCQCGGKYIFQNISSHNKSKKHINFMNSQQEQQPLE
jgi:hypothetical protein